MRTWSQKWCKKYVNFDIFKIYLFSDILYIKYPVNTNGDDNDVVRKVSGRRRRRGEGGGGTCAACG